MTRYYHTRIVYTRTSKCRYYMASIPHTYAIYQSYYPTIVVVGACACEIRLSRCDAVFRAPKRRRSSRPPLTQPFATPLSWNGTPKRERTLGVFVTKLLRRRWVCHSHISRISRTSDTTTTTHVSSQTQAAPDVSAAPRPYRPSCSY